MASTSTCSAFDEALARGNAVATPEAYHVPEVAKRGAFFKSQKNNDSFTQYSFADTCSFRVFAQRNVGHLGLGIPPTLPS